MDQTEVFIDSNDRISGTATNFRIELPEFITNAYSCTIRNLIVPVSWYSIDSLNNTLSITETYNGANFAGEITDVNPSYGLGSEAYLQNWSVFGGQFRYHLGSTLGQYLYDSSAINLSLDPGCYSIDEVCVGLRAALNDKTITIDLNVNDRVYYRATSSDATVYATLTPGQYTPNQLLDELCRAIWKNSRLLSSGSLLASNVAPKVRWILTRRTGIAAANGAITENVPFIEFFSFHPTTGIAQVMQIRVDSGVSANVMQTIYSSVTGTSETWVQNRNYTVSGSPQRGLVFPLQPAIQQMTGAFGFTKNGLIYKVSLDNNTAKVTISAADSRVYSWSAPTLTFNFSASNSLYKVLGFDQTTYSNVTSIRGPNLANYAKETTILLKSQTLTQALKGDGSLSCNASESADILASCNIASTLPFELATWVDPLISPMLLLEGKRLKVLDFRMEFPGNRAISNVDRISFTLSFQTDMGT